MSKSKLFKAFHFFHKHAGYKVGYRARGALTLARAELWAVEQGYKFKEEPDPEVDISWMSQAYKRRYKDGELECIGIVLTDKWDNSLGYSLWGIVDADYNHKRVIQAEIALEALNNVITQYETIPHAMRLVACA